MEESHRFVFKSYFYLWAVLANNMGVSRNIKGTVKQQLRQSHRNSFYLVFFHEIYTYLTSLIG